MNATLLLTLALVADSPQQLELRNVDISVIEQIEVPARALGPLTKLDVEEGSIVKEGAVIGKIEDGDARLARDQAVLDHEAAVEESENDVRLRLSKKSLELAESEYRRGEKTRELFRKAITDEEMEQRRLKVETTTLEVEQAEHDAKQAKRQALLAENRLQVTELQLERCRIVAPLPGVVSRVARRKGEWVEPGEAVVTIMRTDRLRAATLLDADQLEGLEVGQPVTLTLANEKQFKGVLKFISPETNPIDDRVRIWAEIDNREQRIRPGMRASMTVELSHEDDE